MNTKIIRFFEIPVTDLKRATQFYESVFNTKLRTMDMENHKIAMFCPNEDETHGALIQGEGYIPSQQGSLVYFDGGKDMQQIINRIPESGGQITMNKTSLNEHGFISQFIDTEGNKVAIHSEV